MENKLTKFMNWVNADDVQHLCEVPSEDDTHSNDEHHDDTHYATTQDAEEKELDTIEDYDGDDEFEYPDQIITYGYEQGAEDIHHHSQAIRMTKKEKLQIERFRFVYLIISAIVALNVIVVLLITVNYLPPFGSPDNPAVNEVTARYIERGVYETASLNIVTSVLFSYRSFDTLGEALMLFTAAMAVIMLMRNFSTDVSNEKIKDDLKASGQKIYGELKALKKQPLLLRAIVGTLTPFIMIYGIYILFNGHLSPGGSFSGGTILGVGLVLCSLAYGKEQVAKFFPFKMSLLLSSIALAFYAIIKGYAFVVGASGNSTGIPLGTPGNIFSGGLILPLSISVGIVVACTIYTFYALFSEGEV